MESPTEGESGSSRGRGRERESGSSRGGFGLSSEEGSDSSNIFESINFDPQLFIDDLRNAVDDVIEEGFNFFKDQAPKDLGVKDADILNNLDEGVDAVQNVVRLKLDKQLDIWEKYCLMHCFAIPEGLALPEMKNTKLSVVGSSCGDRSSDMDLDTQLEFLREKLVAVGKESAEFHRELAVLERQAAVSTQHAEALDEALHPLEENSTHDVMKEILRTASELHEKMEKLKTERREKMEKLRLERIRNPNLFHTNKKEIQGNVKASLEDLQQILNDVKVMNRT